MKNIIKKIIEIQYLIIYKILARHISISRSRFFLTKLKIQKGNKTNLTQSIFEKADIRINGANNIINFNGVYVSSSYISITGTNNILIAEPDVKLRSTTIHIRGNGCKIYIGKGTTFGSIRIVNVGENNTIEIGKGCLFADNIEIWGSDTHSIYDMDGNIINKEKPIKIEDNVWIGSHTKILKGVTIGEGAIVGMNSMVTKDILPKTLNVGNPVRCIKENVKWSLEYKNV